MVNVIMGMIIVVACLVILEIATSKFLLYISSQIVVVAFIFGNTCKTVFEAVIFVFVIHPFDVGDRCEIDGVQVQLQILLPSSCSSSSHYNFFSIFFFSFLEL